MNENITKIKIKNYMGTILMVYETVNTNKNVTLYSTIK